MEYYDACRHTFKKGFFVFFSTYKTGTSHVAIDLGNEKFINANDSGDASIRI
ncbi:NlpC/P60 family protein [Bacillus subtilis]|uniref:NlpC/P60 family protein n=1 Tax=Bacillus subtilis TaxID=1423 RepID=UPI003EB88D27